jgi:FMN phosphatase YigB (HAD superfamily)
LDRAPSPKAVIFDYGNVLCESQPAADVQALAHILELPVSRFTEIYWQFRGPYDAAALDSEIDTRGCSHPPSSPHP